MSDIAAFLLVVATTVVVKSRTQQNIKPRLFRVDADNVPLKDSNSSDRLSANALTPIAWHRAAYIIVMHDPPEMFFEPKEWSHTLVLLGQQQQQLIDDDDDDDDCKTLVLPSGMLLHGESYTQCAVRIIQKDLGIDVLQPENSLQPLFTFPDSVSCRWCGLMECVYRGSLDDLTPRSFARVPLGDLREVVAVRHASNSSAIESDNDCAPPSEELTQEECIALTPDSELALRLYFQRQGDLRAKRRLLKGYSSSDLEHYGLLPSLQQYNLNGGGGPVCFLDGHDATRNQAIDFTMKTDDGMAPRLLLEADVVLCGVSRSGKTPISLLLSQRGGLKVANVPLVVDVPPSPLLFKVSPKRVFCLTMDEAQLKLFRNSRLRRELPPQVLKKGASCSRSHGMRQATAAHNKSTYADTAYIRRDLEHAKVLAHKHGFTEINVSGRAIEETASLIASKVRERFPESDM